MKRIVYFCLLLICITTSLAILAPEALQFSILSPEGKEIATRSRIDELKKEYGFNRVTILEKIAPEHKPEPLKRLLLKIEMR